MRYILPILLFLNLVAKAQESKQFVVDGKVKNKSTFDLGSLTQYKTVSLDSMVIFDHLLQRKSSIKNIKGVALKDILSNIIIDEPSPKRLSEYYLVFTASDNYKVVFSWNEIFNAKDGNNILILISFDTDPKKSEKGNIAMISTGDLAAGRRFVKGLNKISILQAN
ncbi:molybdopterin-binding protein [Pedobacter frigidisoli]|uniref:Molybdopterin-binding protein n=1 Tax=Pedobacter frigidisoli TaxID=2530455 RepID=A0A4R0NYU6_9SPHI|nr:molybdopterin-binding protein [Pedobacter frigidisoli]TCD07601.1 molybdopterin-binding protein [Pedobacter frigidisoli]